MPRGKAQKSKKKVWGHGNKGDTLTCGVNGKPLKAYDVWCSMLMRCYSTRYQEKFPTYVGCTVCEEWKDFGTFKVWFNANYQEGFQLDKDILVRGNKIYSPETCVFVPLKINSLLLNGGRARGLYPQGVYFYKATGRYRAMCRRHGNQSKSLGYFDTPEEAFAVYKAFKEAHIAKVAEHYYSNDIITSAVRDALLDYEVLAFPSISSRPRDNVDLPVHRLCDAENVPVASSGARFDQ